VINFISRQKACYLPCKLIEYIRAKDPKTGNLKGSRVTQLFNIKKDPWETHNLAVFPEYEETLLELQKEMQIKAIEEKDNLENSAVQTVKINFWNFY